ncbi:uncharacterized protein LTR77_009087 [Saxophila tyrrhenica]|uniref:Alpha-mannosidase n=1 Tax=Saxophila tyrrhenica TaxID=1690608 RepID=A0AAV9P1J3_9PEZI|nr:hypothetical protein LTR77_009087 [Saxophila tyrrhenica]
MDHHHVPTVLSDRAQPNFDICVRQRLAIDVDYNKTQDYNFYTTKRAFMVKHFSYFHRPGSVRYDVPQAQLPFGVNAVSSAQETGEKSTWSVLFMNNQTTSFEMSLQVSCRGGKLAKIVETTNENDWKNVSPLPEAKDGEVVLTVPNESLVTAQFTC